MSVRPFLAPDVAPQQGEEATDFQFARYLVIVGKHWRLVAGIVVLCVLAGGLLAFFATPLYRAAVVMNVERERITPGDVGVGTAFYDFYNPEFLPTQVRLMNSREIVERAVKALNLAADPAFAPQGGAARKGGDRGAPSELVGIARSVQAWVSVTPIKGTTLVELGYVSRSPKQAADVANAIAEAYIDWSVESKTRTVDQASQFLGSQVEQLKAEIEEKERQLQAYGRSKDIISLDPQTNTTLLKLETVNKDYAAAQADRVAKEGRYAEVSTAKPEAIADVLSPSVAPLRADLTKMEREYDQKLSIFKPDWPAMQQLKAEIERTRKQLQKAIDEAVVKARETARLEMVAAQRREDGLKELLRNQKSEAMTLKGNAIEFMNLKVEVETKRGLLDTLLKRRSETDVTSRLTTVRQGNLRIVDRALPPATPFRPSYRQNLLRGLLIGLLLGIGAVSFVEYLDRSLKTSQQVESILKLPALGVIQSVEGGRKAYGYGYGYGRKRRKTADPLSAKESKTRIELLPHDRPRSVTAEAYRAFRTSVLLSKAGGLRSLVVTSAFPGEGKTATAANLAVVLGQLEKRILIIDADLHKPRQHEIFGVSNRVGLVSVLVSGVEPSRAIQETRVPGVSLIAAGPASPNPSGLLSSEGMRVFLKLALENFEYVVIDSPPVQAVADALLIGALVDGAVLCVHGGRTPREHIARVRDKLGRSGVNVLGVLINNLDERAAQGYGDPYRYGGPGYADYAEKPAADVGEAPKRASA